MDPSTLVRSDPRSYCDLFGSITSIPAMATVLSVKFYSDIRAGLSQLKAQPTNSASISIFIHEITTTPIPS
jgi:hypothetical protein